jgi:hypothetical protein
MEFLLWNIFVILYMVLLLIHGRVGWEFWNIGWDSFEFNRLKLALVITSLFLIMIIKINQWLYCIIFCRNKDPHLPFGGHRVTLSQLSSNTMMQVTIMKPTILSVRIWAIIVHTLVVIYVSVFGRVQFLWSSGYLIFLSVELFDHFNIICK